MRKLVVAVAVMLAMTGAARADETMPPSTRWRVGGIVLVLAGCAAVIAGDVMVAEGVTWEIGNGLGEHYDATPSWVPRYETAGGVLIGASQPLIITGIVMLQHADSVREDERQRVTFSLAPTRNGALATLTARF